MAPNRKVIKEILEEQMAKPIGPYADFGCLDDTQLTDQQKAALTGDEVFAMNLINRSLNGDMKATTEILDRRYGKASQHIVQEVKMVTYHDFLDNLVEEEQEDLSQITIDVTPVDGGSAEVDLMNDLGL
ncbi:MAG: hypothetical protein V3V88_02105 [Dehalococcoidia bacterium]